MILTEKEANVTMCPQTFGIPDERDPTTGVGIRHGGPFACIASRCMAWCWADAKPDPAWPGRTERRGRCGLVGAAAR
jgi:hypothetical protein